jgi:serine/threonine-protein kinase
VIWGNLGDSYYYSVNHSQAALAYQKAISLGQERLEVNPRDASALSDISGYYAMLGRRQEALSNLEKALQLSDKKDPDVLFEAAMVHNQLGESSTALEWLEKARSAGFPPASISDAPALDNLHGNAQFQAILQGRLIPKK